MSKMDKKKQTRQFFLVEIFFLLYKNHNKIQDKMQTKKKIKTNYFLVDFEVLAPLVTALLLEIGISGRSSSDTSIGLSVFN